VAVVESGTNPSEPLASHYCLAGKVIEPPFMTQNSQGLSLTAEVQCDKVGQYVLIRKFKAKELIIHGLAILQNSVDPGVETCFNYRLYGPSRFEKEV
jgi:hypothetical protein